MPCGPQHVIEDDQPITATGQIRKNTAGGFQMQDILNEFKIVCWLGKPHIDQCESMIGKPKVFFAAHIGAHTSMFGLFPKEICLKDDVCMCACP